MIQQIMVRELPPTNTSTSVCTCQRRACHGQVRFHFRALPPKVLFFLFVLQPTCFVGVRRVEASPVASLVLPGQFMVQVIGQHAVVEHAVGGHRAVVRHGQWWLSAEKEEKQDRTECNPSVSTLTRRTTCILVDDEKKNEKNTDTMLLLLTCCCCCCCCCRMALVPLMWPSWPVVPMVSTQKRAR